MIYIVYETDAWHTNSSQILTAICSTRKKAMNLIIGHLVKKIGREKMQEQKNLLLEYGQTQGLDTNYLIREYDSINSTNEKKQLKIRQNKSDL